MAKRRLPCAAAVGHLLPHGLHIVGAYGSSFKAAAALAAQPWLKQLCQPLAQQGLLLAAITADGKPFQYQMANFEGGGGMLVAVAAASSDSTSVSWHARSQQYVLVRVIANITLHVHRGVAESEQMATAVRTAAAQVAFGMQAAAPMFLLHIRCVHD